MQLLVTDARLVAPKGSGGARIPLESSRTDRHWVAVDSMSTYALLKMLHVSLALVSGLGFALRGFIRLVLQRPLANPLVRFGPHVVDTLLLASGVGLWLILGLSPFSAGWFGLKLVLILVYILLGITAFRTRHQGKAVLVFLAALAAFLSIAWLALFKPL